VLAHDAAARVISFAKAACQGGLSNFGVVGCSSSSSSSGSLQLQLAASAAGATYVGDDEGGLAARLSSAAAVMRGALAVASDRMWRGVVVQLPVAAAANQQPQQQSDHDAWMNVLCKWPFEFPSLIVVVSSAPELRDFACLLDGFEKMSCEELVDSLLV
jgi:hypothetical protein